MLSRRRSSVVFVALLWAGVVTLLMQVWVGRATVYQPANAERVRMRHQSILENRAPDGSWEGAGMNGTNIRVATVFAAEQIVRVTGRDVVKVYWMIDTVALFASLLLILVFLGRLVPPPYAAVGALAFASVLPLTYQLFYFHPWDRVSTALWIVLLMLIERRRFLLTAALLPVAMAVKYDVLLLPGLVFLLLAAPPYRPRTLVRPVVTAIALFLVTFGTYAALLALRPGGLDAVDASRLLAENVTRLREMHLTYPPFLAFSVPVTLAAVGFRATSAFGRAAAVFGVLMLVPFALRSHFEEFRAQVPVFLLLLPAALDGLRLLLEAHSTRTTASPLVVGGAPPAGD